jgi:mannose-6-phosphate isomerase-like protein (cupin superfamily)
MSFTKKNLRDIPDSAARHGLGEHQESRFARTELGLEQTGLNLLFVKPGRREGFAHRHREAEEVYVVLNGSGSVKLDDEIVELMVMDIVRVAPGTTRSFEAGSDGLEVLIFGSRVEGDAELVSDFWAD